MKKKQIEIIIIFFGVAFLLGMGFAFLNIRDKIQKYQPLFHEHADFALYINGEKFDFTQPQYQTVQACSIYKKPGNIALAPGTDLAEFIHLHDDNGDLVHIHVPGATWRDFFKSLDMEFDDGKLIIDKDHQYFANQDSAFYYYLNGDPVSQLADMEVRDLDQVLISYSATGDNSDIPAELASVRNDACIYSESCTHRGMIPEELCSVSSTKPMILRWLGL